MVALGLMLTLIQYSNPCPFSDLMCGNGTMLYPSTLDLYAVHLLGTGKRVTTVTLPSSIPYQEAPIVPIPEFQGTFTLLAFLTMFSALTLLRTRRKGRQKH
jgi:hypothetical protein